MNNKNELTTNKPIQKKKHLDKNTKIFIGSLTIVVLLIIGLIVGIIVAKNNNDSKVNNTSQDNNNGNVATEDDTSEEDEDLDLAPISKKNYEGKIDLDISNLEDLNDVKGIIDIYQRYIDHFENDERDEEILKKLYGERLDIVLELDFERKYGDVVVADTIKLDEMSKDVESAIQVYNNASTYNKTEVMEQYNKIYTERLKASGDYEDDSETGSRG